MECALELFPESQGKSVSTCPNLFQKPQTHSHMLVNTWYNMSPSLGSYSSSSVNTRRNNKQNHGVPLFGKKSVEINNLTPSKYQSFQV